MKDYVVFTVDSTGSKSFREFDWYEDAERYIEEQARFGYTTTLFEKEGY